MNPWAKIGLPALAIGAVAFQACRPVETFPPEPHIEFIDFLQSGSDSAQIIVSFTDGDGDIGLRDADTLPPYDFNFFLTYYELQNGQWEEIELALPFWYRIPPLNSSEEEKALQGEIAVDLSPFYYAPGADTVRYDVMLRDRALNESNTISTPAIVVPQ